MEYSKILRVLKMVQYLTNYPPKSVSRLEDLLGISTATAYRYLQLLKDIGYDVVSDEHNAYYISDIKNTHRLTDEEKKWIAVLLKANAKEDIVSKSILHKLSIKETLPDPVNLAALHRLKLLNNLRTAAGNRMPVLIKQYISGDSGGKASDRRVIPYQINEYNMSVTAWDMDKEAFRIFKVYRMDDVELMEMDTQSHKRIPPPDMDIFGMAGYSYTEVSVRLSVRAASILKEEYPQAQMYITENPHNAGFPFDLHIKVCGYEGIGRFVLGLMGEVMVISDDGFKNYLRKKLQSMTILTN
ncbi:MAG: WYL domain-containing transcriptional regulator [Saprospiraceae bacterium]|nr:WYL domain-containing transcriptional regulator [Saprospiraceae bacterium]